MNTANFKHVAVILLFGYNWIFYEPCFFARKDSYYYVRLLVTKKIQTENRSVRVICLQATYKREISENKNPNTV